MALPRTFLLLILLAGVAAAQQATLTGRVTDPSGAVVAGAGITVTNTDTGVSTKVSSNNEGYYTAPFLAPGNYRLSLSASGFAPLHREGIRLEVQETSRLDLALQVGEVTQSIEVSAGAQLVDASSSSLGQVIDSKRITELPLNGRNPLELARLSPGVVLLTSAFNDSRNFRLSTMMINGGPNATNAVLLDGSTSTLPERNEYSVSPNVDAVEEFRVQTNSYAAEFGLTGGGVINLVTRGGTNQYKGSLFEFLRNDALDANSWESNRIRIAKPPLRYNQFGGTIGGPVLVPRLYNGRNRTFFFVNFEGIRYHTNALTRTRVPTGLERKGDFSGSYINSTRLGIIPVTLYDPLSTRIVNGQVVRDPMGGKLLPASRVDAVAANVIGYYPDATGPGDDLTGRNNFAKNVPNATVTDQWNFRLDHSFSERDKIFGRYSQNNANTQRQATFDPDNLADPNGGAQQRNNKNAVLGETHIFSPRLFNEFRISVSRQGLRSRPPGSDLGMPQKLGLPALIPPHAFPVFSPGEIANIGNFAGYYATRGMTVWQLGDNVALILGRHSFKMGVDLRLNLRNDFNPNRVSGVFNFGRSLTGDEVTTSDATGFGVATFLLGSVSGGALDIGIARADSFRIYSGYIQDDYKIHPRLTLNLGLRYDIITEPRERFDRYTNFDPNKTNPAVNAPGSMVYAQDFGRSVTSTDFNNFGPRFGFAWDVSGNSTTVVRGGYGIFYYHNAIREYPGTEGYSAVSNFTSQQGMPAFQLKAGPPSLNRPVGSSLGSLLRLGDSVPGYQFPFGPTSYAQQWNFGLQRALPWRTLAEVSYAGNHGVKAITTDYDYNQMDPSNLQLREALDLFVSNPYFAALPAGAPLKTATVRRSQLLRPLPYFNGINVLAPKDGNSIYHSVQVRVEKRVSNGMSVLLAFTGAKKIGDVGRGVIDASSDAGYSQVGVGCGQAIKYDRRPCRSIEADDISRNLVLSSVYELPFGRGKAMLRTGPASWILGNWQMNGILTYRTGQPLIIRGGVTNGAADRPDWLRSARIDNPTWERWFDTSAFGTPGPYQYGNVPRTMPDLRAPSLTSLNFALFKNLVFGERMKFQLRAEAFNAINTVNLGFPNTTYRSTAFGRIESSAGPRVVQLGAKLYF